MFQPDNLSGLVAWWVATSITGVSDGVGFINWYDSSGSGNNLTYQNSSGNLPKYIANGLNGYPTVQFPGPYGNNPDTNFFAIGNSIAENSTPTNLIISPASTLVTLL